MRGIAYTGTWLALIALHAQMHQSGVMADVGVSQEDRIDSWNVVPRERDVEAMELLLEVGGGVEQPASAVSWIDQCKARGQSFERQISPGRRCPITGLRVASILRDPKHQCVWTVDFGHLDPPHA